MEDRENWAWVALPRSNICKPGTADSSEVCGAEGPFVGAGATATFRAIAAACRGLTNGQLLSAAEAANRPDSPAAQKKACLVQSTSICSSTEEQTLDAF
jgi:hypothetical protein